LVFTSATCQSSKDRAGEKMRKMSCRPASSHTGTTVLLMCRAPSVSDTRGVIGVVNIKRPWSRGEGLASLLASAWPLVQHDASAARI
jgi:hypothetical protein